MRSLDTGKFTVIQGDEVPADPAIDLSAVEVLGNEFEGVPPRDECERHVGVQVILSDELPTLQRWSSFNFREWLRQIFSVLTTVPPEGRWAMTKKKAGDPRKSPALSLLVALYEKRGK